MIQADFQDQHLLMVVTFVSVFLRDVQGAWNFFGDAAKPSVCPFLISNLHRPVIFEPRGCWVKGRVQGYVRLAGANPVKALYGVSALSWPQLALSIDQG